MKEELYKKVWIKSEDDLPKEEDVYHVHIRPDNIMKEWAYHKEADHREWMKYIDWYFQSIEQPGSETAEEIDLIQYVTNLLYFVRNEGRSMNNKFFEKWVEESTNDLSAYYASQFKEKPVEQLLTDDIIDAAFPNKSETTSLTFSFVKSMEDRRSGAKWARDQQQIKLREELIKFVQKLDGHIAIEKMMNMRSKEIVDEYLSQKDVRLDYSREDGK